MNIDRLAILWSGNPQDRDLGLLGSPMAHAAYLQSYDSVVWDVLLPNARLDRFEFPMSGYIYSTDVSRVTHRARVKGMYQGVPAEVRSALPPWRTLEVHTRELDEYVSILMDQLDMMYPWRKLSDFTKENGEAVQAPPRKGYVVVLDPLY